MGEEVPFEIHVIGYIFQANFFLHLLGNYLWDYGTGEYIAL